MARTRLYGETILKGKAAQACWNGSMSNVPATDGGLAPVSQWSGQSKLVVDGLGKYLADRQRRVCGRVGIDALSSDGPRKTARACALGAGAFTRTWGDYRRLAVFGWWMVPVVVLLVPCMGHLLFCLCNNTQHIGLRDNVSDFWPCCRTFTLHPFVRFLYWQMNYHIEHHMYAAVPCYNLGRLHQLIRHGLPPTPDGLVAVWRDIGPILARQADEPGYQHAVTLPVAAES